MNFKAKIVNFSIYAPDWQTTSKTTLLQRVGERQVQLKWR